MEAEKIASKEFDCKVWRETSMSSTREPLGNCQHTMELYRKGPAKVEYFIEWDVRQDGEEVDFETIGIWVKDNKVTEYDGVFEILKEAIELLEEQGLDCSEIKEDD